MDTIESYRQAIKQVLQEFVDYVAGSPSHQTELFVVSDDQKNTYTVFELGWEDKRRIFSLPVLMRLVNGKIWVEADNTDYVFVDRLLEAGVPKTGIVLAFHAPAMRPYTEFAVA
jgi:hypothetical protein